ncbi:MAG: response regulator [Acidobacteriota bacterium]
MPSLHVLLIDDDEEFRRHCQHALTTKGYRVELCTSGAEALALLPETHADVVLLDHSMAAGNGMSLFEWMQERMADVPVVLLVNRPEMEASALEALTLGAYDYVRKDSFSEAHLPVVIEGVYERSLFRREKDRQIPSLEMLRDTVTSIAHIVNTNLSVISLNIDERTHELQGFISNEEGRAYLEKANSELKQEYNLISLVSRSLIELSNVMVERFKRAGDTRTIEEEMQNKIKSIQREHTEAMDH